MIKPFPLLSAAGLFGCVCLFAVLLPTRTDAQGGKHPRGTPAASPTPAATPPPLSSPAASPAPAANVEAPTPAASPTPEDPNAQTTETEILASQGANFASKDRIAVFMGDVRVNDPRFQLACDKLTVYLNKNVVADTSGTPAPSPSATPTPLATPSGSPAGGNGKKEGNNPGGGIDHAVAEGHVIIIQKRPAAKPGDEPKISIGRCDRGEFDNKTGDMTLRGTPSIEQNGNSHVALAPNVVMILHHDNSLETHGPSRTILIQHKGQSGGSPFDALPGGGNTPKPGNTPPAGSPAPRRPGA